MSFRFRRRSEDQTPQEPYLNPGQNPQQQGYYNPNYNYGSLPQQQRFDPRTPPQMTNPQGSVPYPTEQGFFQGSSYAQQEHLFAQPQPRQPMGHSPQPMQHFPNTYQQTSLSSYGHSMNTPQGDMYTHPFQASQLQGIPPYNTASPFTYDHGNGQTPPPPSGNAHFTEDGSEAPSPIRLLVLVVGFTILAGLSWFAYKWVKAPSSDAPPLIHAEAGPHKVAPDHRGGVNFPHQDKLIYSRISNNAEEPEEQLLPPPEHPEMTRQNQMPETPEGMQVQSGAVQPQAQNMEALPAGAGTQQVNQPQTMQHAPITTAAPAPVAAQPPQEVLTPSSAPNEQTAATEEDNPKEKPIPVIQGNFFVQLATVKSEKAAISEWKRLKNKHNLKDQKSQIKQYETPDGETVYRLLMGPFDDKVKALKHAVRIGGGTKLVQVAE